MAELILWLWFPASNISAVVETREDKDRHLSHVVCDAVDPGWKQAGMLRVRLNLLPQRDESRRERAVEQSLCWSSRSPAGTCSLWRLLQHSEVRFWRDSGGLLLPVSTDALSFSTCKSREIRRRRCPSGRLELLFEVVVNGTLMFSLLWCL